MALIAFAVFVRENNIDEVEDVFESYNLDHIFWTVVGSGVLLIIISLLGCVGAKTESKCVLGLFIFMINVCLIVQIMAMIFVYVDDVRVYFSKKQWHAMTDASKTQFEQDHNCSGFAECYDVIEDKLKSHFTVIGAVSIGIAVYQLGLLCFTCVLCRGLPDNHEYSRVTPRTDTSE